MYEWRFRELGFSGLTFAQTLSRLLPIMDERRRGERGPVSRKGDSPPARECRPPRESPWITSLRRFAERMTTHPMAAITTIAAQATAITTIMGVESVLLDVTELPCALPLLELLPFFFVAVVDVVRGVEDVTGAVVVAVDLEEEDVLEELVEGESEDLGVEDLGELSSSSVELDTGVGEIATSPQGSGLLAVKQVPETHFPVSPFKVQVWPSFTAGPT